jgi:glutamate/tyrosine decarboxylase-like PLP-dependent enzyme
MRAELLEAALADVDGPTIVCAQAGEVNTGAFDDVETIVAVAHAQGAWVHVDGAFGLWAAASPKLAHLVQGHAAADSWATDAHKWLNVPYDCGIAICAHPAMHAAAMEYAAPYLAVGGEAERDPMGYSPEFSRRARSLPAWAAIRSLGREGLAEMIEGSCANAVAIAEGLAALPGCEIINDVVLNQVLLRFESDERTQQIVAAVQQEGEAWMSPTVWEGRSAIRISVSCWRTDDDDVRRTIDAFARAVAG